MSCLQTSIQSRSRGPAANSRSRSYDHPQIAQIICAICGWLMLLPLGFAADRVESLLGSYQQTLANERG